MARRGVIGGFARAFVAASALAAVAHGRTEAATLGANVDNIATVSYSIGAIPSTLTTPPARFTIEAARTPSSIEFFRYAPNAPDGAFFLLNGSDYEPSPGAGFAPVGPLTAAGGGAIPSGASVRLTPAAAYFSGEPIIIRVVDPGQNGDPATVESLVATIRTANGDFIALRLYESGPDTGEFLAWTPSVTGAVAPNDSRLTIAHGATLLARYQDPFDSTEVSTDSAGVDPYGRVFDSLTGALIDGARVDIVDAATGQPASVFGIDGVSAYPSSLVTGESVTDAGGLLYPLGPGEFRFPIMAPGAYRLVVTPPAGYAAPSSVAAPSFAGLANAPFTIVPGSYGAAFTLSATGDVELDVPVDPATDIVLIKRAEAATASIGDFARYDISVENRASGSAAVRVNDQLPPGFRYQKGSARLNGEALADPQISADGRGLTFDLGLVAPASVVTLAYVVEIAAGAEPGQAVNRAQAVSLSGVPISNRAEAVTEIMNDFLHESLTIAGRIVEDGCDFDAAGPKNRRAAKGVAGIRVYMETGATVVSDEKGLFHFERVSPRTHVVQVDEASLPAGFELVQCVNNTRIAGSPRSQFVDATSGKIWRANFFVRKIDGATPVEPAPAAKSFNADQEYLAYDKIWLSQQPEGLAWVYPAENVTPSAPSANIGLKHDAMLRAELYLNGREVPEANFAGREISVAGKIALSRWKGVDLVEGENRFEAILSDAAGIETARIGRTIDYVNQVDRVLLLRDETKAFADGRTRPVIAVRATDGAGRPVRAGRLLDVEIAPPFRAVLQAAVEQRAPLDAPLSAKTGVPIGQNGVALIELEPTVETGLAQVTIGLDGGGRRSFAAYVKPAPRDWIVVGLAEGEGGFQTGGGALESRQGSKLIGDGRIAGFAKGTIKGDWLVTLAGDSRNERGNADDELFEVIDPDERYPLYGDRSNQHFEAQSRYPVYLKAEKEGFKAEFGDYRTGLMQSKLGRYDRRLSGLQTVYEGERFAFSGFAAETNQAFVKDEIAADGTSGPFRLSAAPLVRNSETILIETRDRFRPDVIVASIPLVRYADYDIDFDTGEIILRLPAPATDAAFNPNVIVVDYETAAPVDRNLTAGGRGAIRFFKGRGEVGATFIHEEAPGISGERTSLAAADVEIALSEKDSARFEYATTLRNGPASDERADAVLAEFGHTGKTLAAKAHYSRIEPGFGLAQQTSATVGVERFGAEASLTVEEFADSQGSARGARFIDAKAYREQNLETGASREVAEIALRHESNLTSGAVGLRGVRETPQGAPEREGLFALTNVRQRFDDVGLSLRAAHERPIAGKDASALFPKRTSLGFDQRLFDALTLSATHEILDGDRISQANTTVGLTAEPWSGGKVTLAGDRLTQDSGERIGATFGVDQQVKLSDQWTASLGLARRKDLKERGAVDAVDDIVPDDPRSPFEAVGGAYTSLYVGAGYRDQATSGSSRFEMKKTESGQRYMIATGAARELSEQLSFAAVGRFQQDNNEVLADERRFEMRFGAAWRPDDDGLIILNRFDLKQCEIDQASESWKVVHNFTFNAMATEKLQVAINHGFKYSVLTMDDAKFDGVTELIGAEARYDVTDRIDVGFHGEGLYSFNTRTLDWSYGPSVGFTPADNVWLSFGWNFNGFIDEDFAAAEYSRAGPYLKLRIKFDQTTARGLLDAISPERVQ